MRTRLPRAVGGALTVCMLALIPTPACGQCQLQCDVKPENYTIGLSCESGERLEKYNDQTKFEYTPSGTVGALVLTLNRERTYTASKRTYQIAGTIRVDKTSGRTSYDIRVTGGLLGATGATCKAGDVVAAPPPKPAASAASVAPPPPRKLNVAVDAGYQPAISVPACLEALKGSGSTFACFVGEPREYISKGRTWLLPARIPPPSATLVSDRVQVSVQDGKESWERWDFRFSPPKGSAWRAGLFENAARDGFHDAQRAGLSISGHSSGCGEVAGRFEVLELVADAAAQTIERFAANFEQDCDKSGRRLRGIVRFNSTIGR